MNNNYEHVYIYGDFNLNILDLNKNKFISEYVESLFSHGFIQLITKPTRIAENSATLLDHILTNSTVREHDTFILCSKLSDHFPIIHLLNFEKTKQPKIISETRNFSPDNILRFKNALAGYNWNHVIEQNCVQEATNNFLSTFDTLYNAFFPISTKKFCKALNPIEPWMSRGILTSRKQKNHLSFTCLKNPTFANVSSFKKFRNLYNQVIRNAKKLYFEKQLQNNQKNLRKTWQILFSAIHKDNKKKIEISNLNVNGVNLDDLQEMACHFNKFFASIASKTVENINPLNNRPDDLIAQNPNIFSFNSKNLTRAEILEATKLLADKKTPDPTGVSANFIKQTIESFINPLFHILNLSLKNGTVPLQFKIAKVIPIHKTGDKSVMDNYRPISLLSTFSKIMEKIVASRLTSFLEENNIFEQVAVWFQIRTLHVASNGPFLK